MGQLLPNAQPVQMMPGELQSAHTIRQILNLELVSQAKESTSHLQAHWNSYLEKEGALWYLIIITAL